LIAGASIAIAIRPASAPAGDLPPWLDPAAAMILAQIGLILIPAILFVWLTRQPIRTTFKLHPLSYGTGVRCFLIGLLCWPLFVALSNLSYLLLALFNPGQTSNPANAVTSSGSPWIAFLGIVLVAPVFEELLFRGVLLSAYEEHKGVHSIWMVGLLFAFYHFSPDQFLGPLFIGLLAGWVVYRTRSVWAGVLVHVGTNLLGGLFQLLLVLAVPGGVEVTLPEAAGQGVDILLTMWMGVLVWGSISLILLVPILFLVRNINKRYPMPSQPETHLELKTTWSYALAVLGMVTYFGYRLFQA